MPLEVGTTLPLRRIDFVNPDTMRVWAPILADPNPIHLDRDAVRAKGLGDRRVNQGVISAAYVMDMLQASFAEGFIVSFSSRFIDNVYEGETVEASAKVTAIEQIGIMVNITCDFVLTSIERGSVLIGNAVVSLPSSAFSTN
ncbi:MULTISPECIES: MaoC family dehydratase [unclassified Chelatococcus]|uniref:MaoC family dehydratase n=1 Tax=unclassified Chelatococcus TaxID=2638111 RepID=UPI001BCFFF47|nr:MULTISPECIES: MaoC family dehydratase [unclassified Chelatococcus]MBS7743728.1 MaoC family dehydratase [Chelatococcus sp. HY11]MBX3547270.1 MaoC family dehydratase [Chelatococcus sp.]CAH1664691.1 Dehydratase [Hyphomicrobiales bacterium]CAH1688431.1 Dehydratase [Hyphomicrobiales bacterium]